jgi:protein SCO1
MRAVILALVALACIGCQRAEQPVAVVAAPAPATTGADFALTDHNNQPFQLSSLRGKVVLIFFGFTSCPDACPTTLSKLSVVYRKLGADAARVKTLYISVDPERDTPQVLKDDLANFRIDALGLTGTKAQIDKVVAQYGASYQIVPLPDSEARYTVAHSTTLYALDPAGNVRQQFAYEAGVDEITAGLQSILAAGP